MENASTDSIITILRHGESLHNIDRQYPFPDPPLTEKGRSDATQIMIEGTPDIVIVSPMTRTMQTAIQVFGSLILGPDAPVKVQVWPELREAHDAICNKGIAKADIVAKFPDFDFSDCHELWDYERHTFEGAVARAEIVRQKLRELGETHKHIALVTHRGLIAFLVQGPRFQTCETRTYRFANEEETLRRHLGVNVDALEQQDFGEISLKIPMSQSDFGQSMRYATKHWEQE